MPDPSAKDNPDYVGAIIGTEESTPLEFWVGVDPDRYIQLDDVIAVERELPNGETVKVYGVVNQLRAKHDGARFDNDVFLVRDGELVAEVSEAAEILATRFEPETYVPPRPGAMVVKATGEERDQALFFDAMKQRVPAGLSRDGQPVYVNAEFLDGSRGGHINISGVSGVATKTTFATFMLHSVFASKALRTDDGKDATLNSKALVFNVKGEDLLFLDCENATLAKDHPEAAAKYEQLGLPATPFSSVGFWAPPAGASGSPSPKLGSRTDGAVAPFFWTIYEFCQLELLQFLFADAQDERQQYTTTIHQVTAKLKTMAELAGDSGAVTIDGRTITSFRQLADFISGKVLQEGGEGDKQADAWRGRSIGMGTASAFVRRLNAAIGHVESLIRGDVSGAVADLLGAKAMTTQGLPVGPYGIKLEPKVTVVDIHNLNDRAQRFVVGVMLRSMFRKKEEQGTRTPVTFVVLDELNKYAPRDGTSPIKDILLDIAERGRSLGIILIGAQQTASEVERRIVGNSAIRVVGRLDAAEASRPEYAWLPQVQRKRATIIKPGTMIVGQPQLPVPLVVEFPMPAWATRSGEANLASAPDPTGGKGSGSPEDPFESFDF